MSEPTRYRLATSVPAMFDFLSTIGSVHRTRPGGDAQGVIRLFMSFAQRGGRATVRLDPGHSRTTDPVKCARESESA